MKNSFKPCRSTCEVYSCEKNKNPNKEELKRKGSAIERAKKEAKFKKDGCPYEK